MTVIYVVILFVLLIFPHELGHFLAAKAVGVKVNEFSFGMGPAIFQRQRGETTYSIRIVPIGGFCALEGENGDSADEGSFSSKPGRAKIFVLLSGSGMNVLIAIAALSITLGVIGFATTDIDKVQAGSPAFEAGIEAGDRIVSVDGKKIGEWSDISKAVTEGEGELTITLKRNGDPLTVNVTPRRSEDGRMIIGVVSRISHDPFTALAKGGAATWKMIGDIFRSLKMLVTGEAPISDISGPVGIISMVSDTSRYGLIYFGFLIALISLNLALINLLPLPALDGGRIIFVIIRAATGKRITDEMEGKVHMIGMALLIALLVFVTFNDIVRLFK